MAATASRPALRAKLAAVFETEDFDYWLTASGTASNALGPVLLLLA
jgi:hypothetical protein